MARWCLFRDFRARHVRNRSLSLSAHLSVLWAKHWGLLLSDDLCVCRVGSRSLAFLRRHSVRSPSASACFRAGCDLVWGGSWVAFYFSSRTVSFMCAFACLSLPGHSSRWLQPCKFTVGGYFLQNPKLLLTRELAIVTSPYYRMWAKEVYFPALSPWIRYISKRPIKPTGMWLSLKWLKSQC